MRQSYHELLYSLLSPAPPPSPLGPKPVDLRARQAEARRLSELMAGRRPFCFLRLGDMDLSYLLAMQEGCLDECYFAEGPANGTLPAGNPGIGPRHAARFEQAFVGADYVDFHERLWPMEHWLPRLRLPRCPSLHRNPDRDTSYLSLTWLESEFRAYCQGRRAEAICRERSPIALLYGRRC